MNPLARFAQQFSTPIPNMKTIRLAAFLLSVFSLLFATGWAENEPNPPIYPIAWKMTPKGCEKVGNAGSIYNVTTKNANGTYSCTINVKYEGTAPTSEATLQVAGKSAIAGGVVPAGAKTFTAPQSYPKEGEDYSFTLDPLNGDYTATLTYTDETGYSPPPQKITLKVGGGCSSGNCISCDNEPEIRSVYYRMPMGLSYAGDSESFLVFKSELINNPGRSALTMSSATGYSVDRDLVSGVIKSATSETAEAVVTQIGEPEDVDPDAFKIDFKHRMSGSSGAIFQTVVFENPSPTVMRISITKDNGSPKVYDYSSESTLPDGYQSAITLSKAGGLWRETKMKGELEDHSGRKERVKVELRKSDSTYDLQSDVESTFAYTPGGEKKVKEIIDPGGASLVTDWEYYDYDGSFQGGKLKSMTRYDGYEESYSYTQAVTVAGTVAGTVVTETKESNYAGTAKGLKEVVVRDSAAGTTTTTRSVGTQTISKTVEILGGDLVTSRTYVDANNYLETKTEYYPVGEDFGRQVKKVTHPDGTVAIYEYNRPEDTGGTKKTTTYRGVPATGAVPISEGTKTETVINAQGELESEIQTVVGTGNGTVLSQRVGIGPDAYGRPASIGYFPNGSGGYAYTTGKTYSCCGVATETDQNSVTTTYAYDDLKRRVKTNRLGVTTATVYDGLTVSTHRFPETAANAALPDLSAADDTNCIAKSFTNAAGTLTESWSPDPSITVDPDGALVKTTTATTYSTTGTTTITNIGGAITWNTTTKAFEASGGSTQYSYTHPDGRAWKTNGALAPAMQYAYGANATGVTGEWSSQSYLDGTNLRETTTTQTDWAGRTRTTTKGSIIHTQFYNSLGQLKAVRDADGVTTLYGYNALGERETTALARTAVTDPADRAINYSTDRVTTTQTAPATRGEGTAATTVLRTTTTVWQDMVDPDDPEKIISVPTTVSTADRTPDGRESWSKQANQPESHSSSASISTIGLNFSNGLADSLVSDAPADGFTAWTDSRTLNDTTSPGVQTTTALPLGDSGVTVTWISSGASLAGSTADNERALYRIHLDDAQSDPSGTNLGGNATDLIGVRVQITGLSAWLAAEGHTSYQIRAYTSAGLESGVFHSVTIHGGDATATALATITPAVMGQADFPTAPGGDPTPRGYGDSPDTLSADTITLTMPVGTTTTCGTLAAIKITGIGTSETPATSTPDGSWVESSQAPDGTRSVTTYSGGRPLTATRYASDGASLGTFTQGFDFLGRPAYSIDSRTGTTITAYLSATCDAIASVKDPGSRETKFTYDHRGNRLTTTLPGVTSVMHTSYDTHGRVRASWGSQTNPVFHQYDYAGRLKTLYTWKITPTLSQTTLTPPGTLGTPAAPVATRWQYDPATGLLTGKFNDYKVGNLTDGPTYAYTAAGRLQTRTWKRGITTGYYYSMAGDLIAVNYSDAATPDIRHTRDRLGRATTSAQGTLTLTGTVLAVSNGTGIAFTTAGPLRSTTYGYNANLQLSTEITDLGDGFPAKTLTRTYETAGTGLIAGRPNGYTFTGGSSTWTYDAAGRPSTLTYDTNKTFTYGYLPDSGGLIATVTGPAHTITNTWETTRDVLATKVNKETVTSSIPSSFAYFVNAIGQRETVGPVVADSTPVSTYKPEWNWDYNDRGELIEAKDQTTAANHRAFQYDAIGNRQKTVNGLAAALDTAPVNYEANALNQYTKANNVLLPTAPTPAPYDQDGNLRFDGGVNPTAGTAGANAREYLWDAENRLTDVKIVGGATLVTYAYDHLSRLVSRTDSSGTTRYLYDGWNRIAEYAGQELKKTYLWGMDLSGSMQGAGGVGGLLAVFEHSWSTGQTPVDTITSFYPTFDGNGNVTEYLNTDGVAVAHYEYAPFGNTVVSDGTKKQDFAYRFSTKPVDPITGLYYYGYRWYDPLMGRWPSKDRIEERGGRNLYGFVGNDGTNRADFRGLAAFVVEGASSSNAEIDTNADKNFAKELGGLSKLSNRAIANLKDFKKRVNDLSEDDFKRLVIKRKVGINGSEWSGSKQDYIKKVEHEFTSRYEVQENGEMKDLILKAIENSNSSTESYDDAIVTLHGRLGIENDLSTNTIDYLGQTINQMKTIDDLKEALKGTKNRIVCCYQKGKIEELRLKETSGVFVFWNALDPFAHPPADIDGKPEKSPYCIHFYPISVEVK